MLSEFFAIRLASVRASWFQSVAVFVILSPSKLVPQQGAGEQPLRCGRTFSGVLWPRLAGVRVGWASKSHGSGDQVLLPVWHNVNKSEVMDYAPSLAGRVARSTATHPVEEIAAEIVDVIQNPPEA